MTNYDKIKNYFEQYFATNNIYLQIETKLVDASYNDKEERYLYSGKRNLAVISMDNVANDGYRKLKNALGEPVNTVDALLVDRDNEWYFIEFKDCKISSKKDNIEKKGTYNFLMLLDILKDDNYKMWEGYSSAFEFARNKITYIVVCSSEKDPYSYDQIRSADIMGVKYTPPCLQKFKDYFFKDAYAYTIEYFENRFVNSFTYA